MAIDTVPADVHESCCVQRLFDFTLTSAPPPRVIGDKAYDSDKLDAQLTQRGVELIAPHRGNRKPENVTQDRRPLRRSARRRTGERTIAWLQNYRRLCIRWEKPNSLFTGFLHITCTLLSLSEVLR